MINILIFSQNTAAAMEQAASKGGTVGGKWVYVGTKLRLSDEPPETRYIRPCTTMTWLALANALQRRAEDGVAESILILWGQLTNSGKWVTLCRRHRVFQRINLVSWIARWIGQNSWLDLGNRYMDSLDPNVRLLMVTQWFDVVEGEEPATSFEL